MNGRIGKRKLAERISSIASRPNFTPLCHTLALAFFYIVPSSEKNHGIIIVVIIILLSIVLCIVMMYEIYASYVTKRYLCTSHTSHANVSYRVESEYVRTDLAVIRCNSN